MLSTYNGRGWLTDFSIRSSPKQNWLPHSHTHFSTQKGGSKTSITSAFLPTWVPLLSHNTYQRPLCLAIYPQTYVLVHADVYRLLIVCQTPATTWRVTGSTKSVQQSWYHIMPGLLSGALMVVADDKWETYPLLSFIAQLLLFLFFLSLSSPAEDFVSFILLASNQSYNFT